MKQQKSCRCQDKGIVEVCNIPGVGNIQLESVESRDEPIVVCVHIDTIDSVSHTLEMGWDHKSFKHYQCYTQYAEGEEAAFNLVVQACQLIDVYEHCATIYWTEQFHHVANALGLEVHHFHCSSWVQVSPIPEYVCIHDLRQQRYELAKEIAEANKRTMVQMHFVAKLRSLMRAVDTAIQVEEGIPAGTIIQ